MPKTLISSLVFPILRLEKGHTAGKWWKCYVKGYLVSRARENKIPTAIPMLSGLTFSMAITFMSLDVAVTSKVNRPMAVKEAEVLT